MAAPDVPAKASRMRWSAVLAGFRERFGFAATGDLEAALPAAFGGVPPRAVVPGGGAPLYDASAA